jgi:hypothetical protein
MRRTGLALVLAATLCAGCGGGGYWHDATHRPTTPGSGSIAEATGPTVDPRALDAHSALPREALRLGRRWGGDPPILGIVTGSVLLVGLAMAVYTIRLVYRRPPR